MNLFLSYFNNNFTFFQPYLIDSFNNDDDFLVVLLLMGALFFIVATIIGVILGLFLIAILVTLLTVGIVSTSVLVGLHQKSLSKGFKTFFITASIVGCTIISVLFFWFINNVKDLCETKTAIIAGIICGIASGWLVGLLLFIASKRGIEFITNKFRKPNTINPIKKNDHH